jgi:K(+)-stimulated pyrophosphate-energized sodium pump
MLELVMGAGGLSILFAIILIAIVVHKPSGSAKMVEIAKAIQEGAGAFLRRQFTTIAIFTIVIGIILYFATTPLTAGSFVLGAILSALSGWIGMAVAVRANVRTAQAAHEGIGPALNVSFWGGAVNGFAIAGLGLLGVAGLYYWLADPALIIGLAFGASLVSLFGRVGGGIYTKAADVGADLVGKVEKNIPEDDPRNAGVIADNVGDNVGDCAGMGADMFESYVVTLIAAMLLGTTLFGASSSQVLFPMLMAGSSIIASIIGMFFVRMNKGNEKTVWNKFMLGLLVTAVLSAFGFAYFASQLFANWVPIFGAGLVGLITTILIVLITDHYTARDGKPVRSIAEASRFGAGTNVIAGLAVGMKSTMWPVIVIAAAVGVSFWFAGLYGIAIASMGLLSMTAIIMAIDTFGPIADNAGGIAEMAGLPDKVRKNTDPLDAIGNTTKATTKGIAIASAALSALTLFASFVEVSGLTTIDVLQPVVLIGLLLGAAIPFLFASYLMRAVGSAAQLVVAEVRRQFKEIKGLMSGKARADYARCVDICTRGSLRQLFVPGLIAVLSPVLIGFVLGPAGLAGAITGAIASGLLLAFFLSNAGASWDNAKKYVEKGNFGGKGSDAHKAAVVGDTVGDPSKDTAGPSINPLIKVMNTLSIVLAALFVQYGLIAAL